MNLLLINHHYSPSKKPSSFFHVWKPPYQPSLTLDFWVPPFTKPHVGRKLRPASGAASGRGMTSSAPARRASASPLAWRGAPEGFPKSVASGKHTQKRWKITRFYRKIMENHLFFIGKLKFTKFWMGKSTSSKWPCSIANCEFTRGEGFHQGPTTNNQVSTNYH